MFKRDGGLNRSEVITLELWATARRLPEGVVAGLEAAASALSVVVVWNEWGRKRLLCRSVDRLPGTDESGQQIKEKPSTVGLEILVNKSFKPDVNPDQPPQSEATPPSACSQVRFAGP